MINFEKWVCSALFTFIIATASAIALPKMAPGVTTAPEGQPMPVMQSAGPPAQTRADVEAQVFNKNFELDVTELTRVTGVVGQFLFGSFGAFYVAKTLRQRPRARGKLIIALSKALVLMAIGLALPNVLGFMLTDHGCGLVFD